MSRGPGLLRGAAGALLLVLVLVAAAAHAADPSAGADAVLLKRSLSTDFLPALTALHEGRQYLLPGLSRS